MPQSLFDVPELSPYLPKLQALGYETYEQFTYSARAASLEMARYLGVSSIDDLLDSVSMQAEAIPVAAQATIRASSYPLGVAIERVPRYDSTYAPSINAVRAAINLIPDMPEIRAQENRGTCVAFATLSAFEHYLILRGARHDLSEQFLYWNCKQSDGLSTAGTYLGIAFPLLQRDGCCSEAKWRYNPNVISGNEGHTPPPGGAQLEALSFRLPYFRMLPPTDVTTIKAELAENRAVAFSIPVYNSWYQNEYVALTGTIGMPTPSEVRVSGHAMCLVGYEDDAVTPGIGGGRFLVRNSWGDAWGIESVHGVGYGTIPYAYIARYCAEAYSADDVN